MKFPAFEPIDLKNDSNSVVVEELYLSQVLPNPNQPRKRFEENALQELALSIKQHGVIQPIIVQKKTNEQYEIIAGERRWRASKFAGLEIIPAIVRNLGEEENIVISLIENMQREELNPIELAQTFHDLSNNHGLSHGVIASMVGKSRVTITNFIRLLNLTNEIRILLISGKLEMGHAKALVALSSEQQIIFAQKIISRKLTVRETEKLVQQKKQQKNKTDVFFVDEVGNWINSLSKKLSTKVSVKINAKGEGKVVIHFTSPKEVDWLVDYLPESDLGKK